MNQGSTTEHRGNEIAAAWRPGIGSHAERVGLAVSGSQRGIAGSVRASWVASYGPFEWVALGYLAISSALVVIFSGNLAHPFRLLCVQGLVTLVILALCRAEANVWSPISGSATTRVERRDPLQTFEASRSGQATFSHATFAQRFWHFWRHWYPHLFFLFCFEEMSVLVHLVSPRWQDAKLIAFDHWLTGVYPAIWLEQFATPGRNEFMQFAYLTYFVFLLVLGGNLYYRKDWHGYWSVMTYSAVAYAIGYVIAIFFPVESPWFAMAGSWHGPLQGGPFTAAINFIEHYGRVRGAAFPSQHVAGSVAALWGALRHRRWLFWVMLPLVICMCASTVWGRYHYMVDIFGGMVTGTLGYVIGKWLMREREEIGSQASKAETETLVRPRFALLR
jgi:membrane-associated phospholipid phosphatase